MFATTPTPVESGSSTGMSRSAPTRPGRPPSAPGLSPQSTAGARTPTARSATAPSSGGASPPPGRDPRGCADRSRRKPQLREAALGGCTLLGKGGRLGNGTSQASLTPVSVAGGVVFAAIWSDGTTPAAVRTTSRAGPIAGATTGEASWATAPRRSGWLPPSCCSRNHRQA